ncbi:MAG: response regulator [Candidatus Promineifilaceae bacterium]
MIEDDPGDADLTLELLGDANSGINVNVVEDGVKAVAYLRNEGDYAYSVRPDFILLDLNLPRKDGREVLQEIKSDQSLKNIPVVVLTTSDSETDIENSYDLGANAFVTKPIGLEEYAKVVSSIEEFWLSIVTYSAR